MGKSDMLPKGAANVTADGDIVTIRLRLGDGKVSKTGKSTVMAFAKSAVAVDNEVINIQVSALKY